jgi:cullin-4
MKKAKHPAGSSSAGTTEKNGIHLDAAVAAAGGGSGRTNGEEDSETVLADQEELPVPSAQASAGVALTPRHHATGGRECSAATLTPPWG